MSQRLHNIAMHDYAPIAMAKKWTGQTTTVDILYGYQPEIPTLSGWYEINESGVVVFPPTEIPTDLPDWVVGTGQRFLVGEGSGSYGPFTLNEALYIYSTARGIVLDSYSFDVSVSSGGRGTSVSDWKKSPDSYEVPDWQSFIAAFPAVVGQYTYRDRNNYYTYDADGSTGDEPYFFSYVSGNVGSQPYCSIAIDVDNPKDYYLTGLPYYYSFNDPLFGGDIFGGGGFIIEGEEDPDQVSFRCFISPNNSSLVTGYLQGVDETYELLAPVTCSLEYGPNKNISFKLYPHLFYVGNRDLISINLSSFKFKVNKYWSFANADGQPVYDTTTGEIINNPVP